MTKINKIDVLKVFDDYKKDIKKTIKTGDIETAASIIEKAAKWALLFNFEYVDYDLEDNIRQIVSVINTKKTFEPIPGRLFFVCSQMHDNGELVRHYVRAIADNNIPTKMVVINKMTNYVNTLREIQEANNIEIHILPDNLGYIETAKQIAILLAEFKPEKILQHFVPTEVKCLIGVSMFPDIPKYNINYTDHTFWLGATSLNFNIEFRPDGCIISHEKRKLKDNQICCLPLYPVHENDLPFEGFPFENKGRVVIYSGSAPYKVFGDNDRYFKILDRILEENENCMALISIYTRAMVEKVSRMNCRDRVYLVPWRRDIVELMKNIDIFYNTYPVGGGLICQLAALFKKPIIAYNREDWTLGELDGYFINKSDRKIAFSDVDKLCDYAHQLCKEESFRHSEGIRLCEMLSTREKFASMFNDIINNTPSNLQVVNREKQFDYEGMEGFYLNYESETKEFSAFLFNEEGLSAFYKYPRFCFEFIRLIANRWPTYLLCKLNILKNKMLWLERKN